MTKETRTLVLTGGGSLMFRDATHRFRRVARGEPFQTDAETAELLLAGDDVEVYQSSVPRGTGPAVADEGEPALEDLNVAQLRDRAEALGLDLPKKATKSVLLEAIAEASAKDSDEPEGESDGEGETDAEGDPVQPPAEPTTGTISIGDLPAGARIAPEQG